MDPIIEGALLQQQQQTALKVQMSVLQKNQEVQKEIGELVVGLISNAALETPGKAIGKGNGFDVYA
jgi:hypothetical protein